MHTLTLCERVPIPHLPPSNSKPSKSSHCCSYPFASPFQIKANHSCPKSHLRLSRHARRAWKYRDINDEASHHLSQTVSDSRNEFRFTSHKAVTLMQEAGALDESVAIPSLTDGVRKLSIFGQDPVPTFQAHLSLFHGIKFALLLALLTFQGPQQAVASSEIAGVMQPTDFIGDLGDISTGFASAFLLIFFSELGDKTFFIAALLASRNSGAIVFVGTFGALAAMTIISVVLGRTFHYVDDILPFRFGETDLPIDDIAAVCLLVYFGVSTLLDAVSSEGLKAEEEQKEAELAVSEFSGDGSGSITAVSTVVSTFLLVFVAEWGDKSFFSTIALAAASSPLGVIAGALAGHSVATLLAVVGGSLLGTFISEKVIAYIGGALFLIFALVTLIEIVS